MDFGKILKERRTALGITQEALAKELNVSRSAISNWEIGRNYPDIHTLIELANILHVSLDDLLSETKVIEEAVQSDKSKKRRLKNTIFILAFLLVIMLYTLFFVFTSKQLDIAFVKTENINDNNIVLFNKEEFKEISLRNKKVMVIFDLEDVDNYAGYYLDGGKKSDEITLQLYKFKANQNHEQRIGLYGAIEVDEMCIRDRNICEKKV
ncbi:hypothetical protein A5844_000346 [Enterococcus sp. 10A9_DIV0425]|uniref:HTH cro/C1-type domain-containing protein n=1 Tax=Candidatus Enterococcus wittei TaxID=1987383 RepID=A0A2C9XPM8_9ENTE|nr:helix-turn-helix domain-containing protein [Enterococcus sp. 10A9_DIV0425]OTP12130.1 hypothetical protein A5844_000346 [Enterococcus sp. 10A9_DIV0425]